MKKIIDQKPFKSIFLFAIPLLIANILNQSYNLVDMIVAGQKIGSSALAATGSTTMLIQFLSSLFWGFGIAFATVIGEFYGAGKKENIPTVIKTVFLFVAGIMLILCGVCVIFSKGILTILKVDPLIFDDANLYFRIFMIALFMQAISYTATSYLQALGDSKYPMIMTSISGLLNLLLNIFFVVTLNWGVAGLAWATVISSGIGAILGIFKTFIVLKKLDSNIKPEFSFASLKLVSRLAVSCILQQCSLYLSGIVVQPVINAMGKNASAGYSVAMNINLFYNAFYHSLSRSVSTYASQSKGAGEYKNYKRGISYGFLIQIILVTPLMLLTFLFPNQIAGLFIKKGQEECLSYVVKYIWCCVPFLYFICFGNLMHSFYKAVEATKTVLITTFSFSVVRIGLTYLIPENGTLNSVYLALSFAWIFEALFLLILYFVGKWKSKEQLELE